MYDYSLEDKETLKINIIVKPLPYFFKIILQSNMVLVLIVNT